MSAAVCHAVFASTGKVEVLRREGRSDDERESGAVMRREGRLDGSSLMDDS